MPVLGRISPPGNKSILCLLIVVASLGIGIFLAVTSRRTDSRDADPSAVPVFSLRDTQGQEASLADYSDKAAVVVVFIGTECPLANLYVDRLKELHGEFAPLGVQFLAINSNIQDSSAKVAEHARRQQLPFAVLSDPDQRVADLFRAERTPEAFVLDARRVVRYHGRIDDQYGIGYHRPQPTRRDLAEALREVLDGKPVRVARTEAAGCYIGRDRRAEPPPATAEITYSKQVARILQKNCQECHRPGQIGPFALLTYRQARAWAATIREVVSEGRMPPWHADPRYGKFSNDRSLSAEDRETLLAWIDQGCPKGDDRDLPPPRSFAGAEGWPIGKPDVLLTMAVEFTVPARAPEEGIPYQDFVIPTDFKEDVWVAEVAVRPGNPAVVHHTVVSVGALADLKQTGADFNTLIVALPGGSPVVYPPGMAKRIPKGAHLVMQMHYTANGVEQKDRSSVGLVLAKTPPKHEVRTRVVYNDEFVIPPGEGNYKVTASTKFDRDAVVLNLYPHMHMRGKSFEYRAVHPDGRSEILLSVPRYDFNWQTTYYLAKPLYLKAGTVIECTAYFDNSANNPNNPDSQKEVRWGPQTWDEMMVGHIDYYYVGGDPAGGPGQ